MEYRPLDITVISAEGIKDVTLFSKKMNVYVVVSIVGYPKSKKTTIVDKDCGTHPKWNHHMNFVVDEPYLTKHGLSLHFQLMTDRSIGWDKEVGEVTVPIDELFQNVNSNPGGERVVEYQLRTSSGKPKGKIKFSYKFGEKFTRQVETKKHMDEPMTAYPAPQHVAGGSMPPHQGMGYGAPPPGMAYQQYPQYPPHPGYGYPPPGRYPPSGYGYPQPGYGAYPAVQNPKKKKSGMGSGLAMGLGAGLLGGMLVGDVVDDAAAYDAGYDDAMGDMGGFDF